MSLDNSNILNNVATFLAIFGAMYSITYAISQEISQFIDKKEKKTKEYNDYLEANIQDKKSIIIKNFKKHKGNFHKAGFWAYGMRWVLMITFFVGVLGFVFIPKYCLYAASYSMFIIGILAIIWVAFMFFLLYRSKDSFSRLEENYTNFKEQKEKDKYSQYDLI